MFETRRLVFREKIVTTRTNRSADYIYILSIKNSNGGEQTQQILSCNLFWWQSHIVNPQLNSRMQIADEIPIASQQETICLHGMPWKPNSGHRKLE